MSKKPAGRISEEDLEKVESILKPDEIVCGKHHTDIFHAASQELPCGTIIMSCGYTGYKRVDPRKPLLTALRNAYAEIDVLHCERDKLLSVIEWEIDDSKGAA